MTFPTLDALIGRVKRSAVDAYFASFEYWRVKDNKYIYMDIIGMILVMREALLLPMNKVREGLKS